MSESNPPCLSDLDILSEEDAKHISQVQSDSELLNLCDESQLRDKHKPKSTNSKSNSSNEASHTNLSESNLSNCSSTSDPDISGGVDSSYSSEKFHLGDKSQLSDVKKSRSTSKSPSNLKKSLPSDENKVSTGLFASLSHFLPHRTKDPKTNATIARDTKTLERNDFRPSLAELSSDSGFVSSLSASSTVQLSSKIESTNVDDMDRTRNFHPDQRGSLGTNPSLRTSSIEIQSAVGDSTDAIESSPSETQTGVSPNEILDTEAPSQVQSIVDYSTEKQATRSPETLNKFLEKEVFDSLEVSLALLSDGQSSNHLSSPVIPSSSDEESTPNT